MARGAARSENWHSKIIEFAEIFIEREVVAIGLEDLVESAAKHDLASFW
jgi:hypothetical protein